MLRIGILTLTRKGSWLFFLLCSALAPASLTAQDSDTTPPSVMSLSFSAATVDVTAAAQNVTVTATLADDLAGVSYGLITFTSPSGQTTGDTYFSRVTGTYLNGVYQATVPFARYAEPGVWTASIYLRDTAGNTITYSSATLVGIGFPGRMTVVDANPDTTPPTLLSASFSPSLIDTSTGPQTVTVTLRITDNQSGAVFRIAQPCPVNVHLLRAAGNNVTTLDLWGSNFSLVTGTSQSGFWQAQLTMPQYSGGSWSLSGLCLSDAITNKVNLTQTQLAAMGINPVLTDVSTPSDITPPTLTGLSLSRGVIDTSLSGQNVTLTLTASDDIAGVFFGLFNSTYYYINAGFRSPSGAQYVGMQGIYTHPAPVAGTPLAGTWQLPFVWPRYSEQGTWNLSNLSLLDAIGNYRYYSTADLQAMGLSAGIVVTKPSQTLDGTVGPAGGTVSDSTFGARSSVTFPPGLLSSSTNIAIDVFATPLAVPTPRGFTMPGTYFTNLSFSPALAEPLPAPGITVVLPLVNPMTPGARLSLYHIDTIVGLTPAMDASRNPVVGSVNADRVSATFYNVVTVSTVVGYLSNGSVLGDVSGDGRVDCADVSLVKSSFGTRTGQAGYNVAADLNNDGTVNILDLFIVSRQLPAGTTCQ
jgi:hypothetical protein